VDPDPESEVDKSDLASEGEGGQPDQTEPAFPDYGAPSADLNGNTGGPTLGSDGGTAAALPEKPASIDFDLVEGAPATAVPILTGTPTPVVSPNADLSVDALLDRFGKGDAQSHGKFGHGVHRLWNSNADESNWGKIIKELNTTEKHHGRPDNVHDWAGATTAKHGQAFEHAFGCERHHGAEDWASPEFISQLDWSL
jgi:hypothetical protein